MCGVPSPGLGNGLPGEGALEVVLPVVPPLEPVLPLLPEVFPELPVVVLPELVLVFPEGTVVFPGSGAGSSIGRGFLSLSRVEVIGRVGSAGAGAGTGTGTGTGFCVPP